MTKMKVKLKIIDLFNMALYASKNLTKDKICPFCSENIETDYEIIAELKGIQIGFNMALSYIKDIAKRAIEINDAVILECLINLGIINSTEEEEKLIIAKVKEMEEL